jgi:hypothetical protein
LDFIDDLRVKDEENFANIAGMFATEVALCNELLELYDICAAALRPHLKDTAHRLGASFACGLARNHLVRGALSLCRAHAAPMFRETRSAAEAAGIAFCIVKHKDMLKVLLDDVGTPETREAVRKTFTQRRIFPKDKRVFRRLSAIERRLRLLLVASAYEYDDVCIAAWEDS